MPDDENKFSFGNAVYAFDSATIDLILHKQFDMRSSIPA